MRINRKIFVGFGVMVAFLIVSAIISTLYTLEINSQLTKITEEINPLEDNVQDMISILWKGNYIVQRYSTEENREILEDLRYEFAYTNELFLKKADLVTETMGDGPISTKVKGAKNKQETFYQLATKLMDNRDEEISRGVIYGSSSALVQYSIAKQLERDVVDAVESLQESLSDFSGIKGEANKQSNKAVKTALLMIFLVTGFGLLVAFVVWESLKKTITAPIKSLSDAASKITNGDFNVEVKVEENNDELTDLAFTFNQMIKSIRKVVEESPRLKKFINLKGQKEKLSQKYILDEGTSYLLKDPSSEEAYEILLEKSSKDFSPFLITRNNPKNIEEKYGIAKKNIIWLSEEKKTGINTTSNLNQIQKQLIDLISKDKLIILLDRSDYILNKYGFENFLKFITNLNDKIMTRKSIFILPIDPEIFSNKQLSLLEKELHKPPQQSVNLKISDELREILKFISNQQSINQTATYKDVGNKFKITAPTTQKKVEELLAMGLVGVSKRGRNKVISPTREGIRVLSNS